MSTIIPIPPLTVNAVQQTQGFVTISPSVVGINNSGYITSTNSSRKPRKPREKRQVPLFTSGLEAKLNKTLDQPANKIIRFITSKVQQPPTITNGINENTYEYNAMFTYVTHSGFALQIPNNLQTIQHTVKFYAKLIVRLDGTLCEYEIRMSGFKR